MFSEIDQAKMFLDLPSCIGVPSTGIIGICHYAQFYCKLSEYWILTSIFKAPTEKLKFLLLI